jgi:formamidopyrimidine-DNA glycosylase
MYGGMGAFLDGTLDNPYYKAAKEKPSPLSNVFDRAYFESMISAPQVQKLSSKAFLATEQRIPGLGNGVLQDVLFNAAIHPKKKVSAFTVKDKDLLYKSVKTTLQTMAEQGSRDTELDIFGHPGGYKTILSKNTAGKPCPKCGTPIKKEAYMGGSIYFCEECQIL